MKRHSRKVGMGEVGDTAETRRGGTKGVRNSLQGSITSGTTFWILDLGDFGGYGVECRGNTHVFSSIYHWETSATDI